MSISINSNNSEIKKNGKIDRIKVTLIQMQWQAYNAHGSRRSLFQFLFILLSFDNEIYIAACNPVKLLHAEKRKRSK